MPRVAATIVLVLAITLAAATPGAAQDRDCSDFDSQAEAQDFFENAGPGDPHRLDADDDGRACDSNPCPCRGPMAMAAVAVVGSRVRNARERRRSAP